MGKYLTGIEELLLHYPYLRYENKELWNDEDVVESDADSLIREYYSEFDSLCPNPNDYINKAFFGNYEDAFNSIQL